MIPPFSNTTSYLLLRGNPFPLPMCSMVYMRTNFAGKNCKECFHMITKNTPRKKSNKTGLTDF